MPSARIFFSPEQAKQIEKAIQSAEENTSGEIRVFIENRCKGEALVRAAKAFHRLGMDKTVLKNGVLFYVAARDKKFAVAGDAGIHKQVPADFWDAVRDAVLQKFSGNHFADGLCEGIAMAGIELKKYFPLSSTDKNELSNEVTFGKS